MFSMLATRSSWRRSSLYGRPGHCHDDMKGMRMGIVNGKASGNGNLHNGISFFFRTNLPNGHFRHDLDNDFFYILWI
jgi:hypothetical protein